MNETAVVPVQKCNTCKREKPWTSEYFDWKHGDPEKGLNKHCRACLNKHHRSAEGRARARLRRQRRRKFATGGDRTTPIRLCYWAQGGIWE